MRIKLRGRQRRAGYCYAFGHGSGNASGSKRGAAFPQSDEITFRFSTGSEITYRLLSGALKDAGGRVHHLSLIIRCSPRSGNGANFWDDTFSLEVDNSGALLAPVSGLNELVEDNSYKDGEVIFEVRGAFSGLGLAIVNPWDKGDIRILALGVGE